MTTTEARCHWWREAAALGTEAVLIPMCMGAAVNGPEGCTCRVPESRVEAAERGRRAAEAEVLRLRAKLDRAGERIADMVAKEDRMRRRLADAVLDGARAMAAVQEARRRGEAQP